MITFRKSIVLHSNLFRWYPKCTPKYALAEISENELHKLNEQLGDAVYLGVKNKENALYLLHFDSKKELRINGRVGGEYPLKTSAPGKVLPAYENHSCEFENEAEQIEKQNLPKELYVLRVLYMTTAARLSLRLEYHHSQFMMI